MKSSKRDRTRAKWSEHAVQRELGLDKPQQPKRPKKRHQSWDPAESAVQRAVIERLALHPHVAEILRLNNGAVRMNNGGDEDDRFIRFVTAYVREPLPALIGQWMEFRALRLFRIEKGFPDLLVLLRRWGAAVKLEIKRPGEEPRKEQAAYLSLNRAFSGVAHDQDEAVAVVDRVVEYLQRFESRG